MKMVPVEESFLRDSSDSKMLSMPVLERRVRPMEHNLFVWLKNNRVFIGVTLDS